RAGGGGGEEAGWLVEGGRHLLRGDGPDRCLVVLQPLPVAGSFARTLHLEDPEITTCVIEAPLEERALDWVAEEVRRATGHVEAHYDGAGRREQPCLDLLRPDHDGDRAGPPPPAGGPRNPHPRRHP